MRTLRRVLAAGLGLVGVVGLVLCVAGVVGSWLLHAEAVRRTDRAFGRADKSLVGVRDELVQVRDRLRQTQAELDVIRQREEELRGLPPADRVGRQKLVHKSSGDISAGLGEARRKLVTATEAALVVDGLLDALAGLPLSEQVGVDVDQLRVASDELSEAIRWAERLAATLAGSGSDPAPEGSTEQSARVAESLARVVAAVEKGTARADDARERIGACRARVTRWLTWAAGLATVALAWAGAGQFSLLVHAGRWFRKRRPGGAIRSGHPPG